MGGGFTTQQRVSNIQVAALLVTLVIGAGTWSYLFRVFLPYQRTHQPEGIGIEANRFDLYPRWLGTRELILHGLNPYSTDVTREIQIGYYGMAVKPGRFPSDEQRFMYPLHVIFFLAPTVTLSFSRVNAVFGLLLACLTIAGIPLWNQALNLRLRPLTMFLVIVAVLASWPAAQGLYARQLTLFVAFLIAWAGAEIAKGRLRIAGVCLACSTIKPQLVLPLLAWLTLWACASWRKRCPLVWSFLTSSALLLLGAEAALPHWAQDWWSSLPAYIAYTGSTPSMERLFGLWPGRILNTILAAAVGTICWRLREHSTESSNFGFAFALVLSTTLIILPTWSLASYNQMLLLPAVLWIGSQWTKQTVHSPTQTLILIFAMLAVAWEPVTTTGISIGYRLFGFVVSETILRIPVYLYFLVPIATTAALLALRPRIA